MLDRPAIPPPGPTANPSDRAPASGLFTLSVRCLILFAGLGAIFEGAGMVPMAAILAVDRARQ